MVSRENTVIVASLAVAIVAYYLVETYAAQPYWVSIAVLIGIGVLVPTLVNRYLERSESP